MTTTMGVGESLPTRGPSRRLTRSATLVSRRHLTTLDSLPVELIDLIINHIPRDQYPPRQMPGMMVPSETTWTTTTPNASSNSALLALCLTSRRLHEICTPHLYRRFEDRSPERDPLGASNVGQRLLLLLRTMVRNPDLGRLVKHVVASTWHSLETDPLTEEDMKGVFEQTGLVTTNYPLRIASKHDPEFVFLGPPPPPDGDHKDQDFPCIIPGYDIMSSGKPAPIEGFSKTDAALFRHHPVHDFSFCSAIAWAHAVRAGEWDAVFTLLLSYLPNMETLAINNSDAGERCPFSQCIYLTSFMERVAISQQMTSTPRTMKKLQLRDRRSLQDLNAALPKERYQESLSALVRKRAHSDSALLEFPSLKRQKFGIAASTSHPLSASQPLLTTCTKVATCAQDRSVISTTDVKPQPWKPLLPVYRSVSMDCIYRSSDVHISDIMPFLRPRSITDFFCGYLYGNENSWPGDTQLSLRSIVIKHGHLYASNLAILIKCCSKLERLTFETAGGYQIPYQTLASAEVMEALEGVKDTLIELDLRRGDMNYWFPSLEIPTLQGYTGYTFDSFADFHKLKRLSLKAETMIRHSEADPDADTRPLWKKLPPSLEFLQLAGNKKWFGNLVPQIQDLVALREAKGILPRLKEVVLEIRGMEGHAGTVYDEDGVFELMSMRDVSRMTTLRLDEEDPKWVQRDLDELLDEISEHFWQEVVDA